MLSVVCVTWMMATTGGPRGVVAPQAQPRLWLAADPEPTAPAFRGPRDMIRRAARPVEPGVPGQPPPAVAVPGAPPAAPPPTAQPAPPGAGVPPGAPPGAPAPRVPAPTQPATAGAPAQQGGGDIDFAERARKGKFSFDFSKAEIVDIVKAISDMTRRNFIIPEQLKGQRITILSPTKITADEAYQVFLAALEVNGISIVRSGKFYKLLQSKDAIKEPVPTCIGEKDGDCPKYTEQIITMILPLQHVDVQQLNPVLQSLKSKEGEIQVFAPTNSLIISEYAHNLTRLRRIIDALDVPGFQDELQLVQIQYATATEISDKLTQIFDVKGGAAGRPGTGRPGGAPTPGVATPPGTPPGAAGAAGQSDEDVQISKIVADDRTNQLIIKANRRSFDAIRRLIARLDIPVSDSEQGRVHVYYLENASAEDLSSTLSSLAQGGPPRAAAGSRPGGTPGTPGAPAGAPRTPGVESATLFEGEVKITADKATNSLLVISSGRDFRSLSRIIEQLDRPRRQVYVETAILEVNVSDSLDFGLDYHLPLRVGPNDPGGNTLSGSTGFFQTANNKGQSLFAYYNPQSLLGIAQGSIGAVLGKAVTLNAGGTALNIPSFGIVLKLLETSSMARILSTPHILTTDNQEASIEVGQKVPFNRGGLGLNNLGGLSGLGGLGTTGATAAGALGGLGSLGSLGGLGGGTVDRIDVSLKLTVTPQINERGKIKLEINQDVEDIVGEVQSTQTPTTAKRAAKTTIVVDDQQTVVIGGLMRDRVNDSETKIPLLGDLPLFGWLFKSRSHKTEKTNLLLVMTPYIIRDQNDFQDIFERKVKEYEEFAADYYGSRPEYRAHLDYTRKRGPLASMVRTLQREAKKAENGGEGSDGEVIVKPRGEPGGKGGTPQRGGDGQPAPGKTPPLQ